MNHADRDTVERALAAGSWEAANRIEAQAKQIKDQAAQSTRLRVGFFLISFFA